MSEAQELQQTPLYDSHVALGGSMVGFAGWEMPVRYGSHLEEHMAVRDAAGLFDVSHMGRVMISGPDAVRFANYLTTNNVSGLQDRQSQYTLMCDHDGGIIDDLIVTQTSGHIKMVINAGNREKDLAWIREQAEIAFDVEVGDVSDQSALIAIQGPRAVEILKKLAEESQGNEKLLKTPIPIEQLGRFRTVGSFVAGAATMVSRTGYTGEDGFELWVRFASDAQKVWDTLLGAGEEFGLRPCGLAARDSLRLEAGLALYGHEIDEQTNPYEAGLGWVTKLGKGEFIGRQALRTIVEQPLSRKLAGLRRTEKGRTPEPHNAVQLGDEVIGEVVSGAFSPLLEVGIATAFLPPELAVEEGAEVAIDVRGRLAMAQVAKLPFYKRS